MTATADPPGSQLDASTGSEAPSRPPLALGEGVELLGDIHGCGYRDGACLVRRGDGQMLQLGPLMYALLESIDGGRSVRELSGALTDRLGRQVNEEQVARLAQKLALQGLLEGTEHRAPPRRNPLLALRWKVLVTDPTVTGRLTAPFTFLFRAWLMWPIVACFAAVFWFVLVHKGVASATTEAFHRPGLLLLVFVLAVVSAGFHELGHAAAARYSGARPGGMGAGLYLVWPAFYTDVTDAYRLPKRARLRVDLAGLYFNAVVAVITMGVWLMVRSDALLLLVALQVLQMVKQLSPVIRADGYHILSDATGVPDLYAHMLPTIRRLLPGHDGEQSALTGQARLLVTLWVLVVVPVLLALMMGAVLLLPHLATTAWDSGRHIVHALPHQVSRGQAIDVLASLVSLLALLLPVAGSVLVSQKIIRTTVNKAVEWSRGSRVRRGLVIVAAAGALAGIAWAWWPAGQYQPVRANHGGTLAGLVKLVSDPVTVARPSPTPAQIGLTPGTHLAVAMIPVDGASRQHPALFVIAGSKHRPAVALLSSSAPAPRSGAVPTAGQKTTAAASSTGAGTTPGGTTSNGAVTSGGSPAATGASRSSIPIGATAFPFRLPRPPGRGGTQALAVGTTSGGVTYDVAYALVTVRNGAPVTNTNGAYALADCNACTTVAVSFQVVLIVGQSNDIAPINSAVALNYRCPACVTTAIADQLVLTLTSQPSAALLQELNADLRQLNALPALGAGGTPAAVSAEVASVQHEIDTQLAGSGLLANQQGSSNSSSTSSGSAGAAPGAVSNSTSQGSSGGAGQGAASPGGSPSSTTGSATTTSTPTPTATPTPTTTTSSNPPTSTTPSGGSGSAPGTSTTTPTSP